MKGLVSTRQFRRDLKLAHRRGLDLNKLGKVIEALQRGAQLPPSMRPHRLKGELVGLWECHISPDWLLIWDEQPDDIILVRTGSHADLFD